ncbi:MAG: 6-phosphogluconolactonase [Acidobacteria bacterium]|nr:6-phosphogluconolactonase [Acidobacteriota bacterium]
MIPEETISGFPNTEIFSGPQELAWAAALRFAGLAEQSVSEGGKFTVALSGGSTPKAMLALLAQKPFADSLPWNSIYFFWGDERCVPPDHADSNSRMANDALLSKVGVPPQNIFRIPAENQDHQQAANAYSETIKQFFNSETPQFDLVFLGMGADGHTASLFPGTAALHIVDRIAVANFVEKLNTWRITLTAQTINQARNVIFLVAGEDKAEALKEVLEGKHQPDTYPSQLIHPNRGSLLWMLDEAAAGLLTDTEGEEVSLS